MKANNIDNFIIGLKEFYFSILKDVFPDITREEFDKLFDKVIDLELTNNLWQSLTEEEKQQIKEISEFIINDWTCDKITIERGEWIQGIPSEDSPNVIPFAKTFYIYRE